MVKGVWILPKYSLLLCTIIATFAVVPVLFAGDADVKFAEDVALVAEISGDSRLVGGSVLPRPGHGKIAYVYEDEHGFKVCMNNDCGPYVDRVAKDMPVVSPDGNHVAAVVKKGEGVRVMLGGAMSKSFDRIYGLRFSPNSMMLAYIGQKDDAFFAYVNQERHRSFALIDPDQGFIFSRDSNQMAYVASKDGQSWHLVKNGKPGPAYPQIKHVTFSPDSNRLAYAAKKDGAWHLVEGSEKSPGYKDINQIRFGPDSDQLAYVARDDQGEFVVVDGEESRPFDAITGELVFSADGDRLAYPVAEIIGDDDFRMRMVIDGEIGPAFHRIGAFGFSPDGGQTAYMGVNDEKKGLMVHDGDVVNDEAYDSFGIPVFSPGGRHLAYFAYQNGKWFIKKDGEKGPAFDAAENPLFCPNGKRMAYLAQKNGRFLVVEDGDIVGDYEWAGHLTFSPDGKHLAYAAAEDGEAFLVVDGRKGEEPFLSFLRDSPLVFTEDNTVQGIAARALADGSQEFWLIRAEIEK